MDTGSVINCGGPKMPLKKRLIILFHAVSILNYVLFLVHAHNVRKTLHEVYPRFCQFFGELNHLTHLNVWIQLIYFTIAFVNDVFGLESTEVPELHSVFQKLRDFIFGSLALPIGSFVTISFWSLFLVDRNLIMPVEWDQYFPPITNHMMHTAPLVAQVLELLFVFHVYPKRSHGFRYVNWFSKCADI